MSYYPSECISFTTPHRGFLYQINLLSSHFNRTISMFLISHLLQHIHVSIVLIMC